MAEENQDKVGKKSGVLGWILWWKVDNEELNRQIEEYDKLGIIHSARGISLLLLIFSAVIQALVIISGNQDFSYIEVFLFLILGYFVFKGKKWAMVTTMVLWTIEKAYSIYVALSSYSGASTFWAILFWAVYMHYFYLAYKVEKERVLPADKKKKDDIIYCKKCGSKLEADSTYCINCGEKVA